MRVVNIGPAELLIVLMLAIPIAIICLLIWFVARKNRSAPANELDRQEAELRQRELELRTRELDARERSLGEQ